MPARRRERNIGRRREVKIVMRGEDKEDRAAA
jgi:hypothetical protein